MACPSSDSHSSHPWHMPLVMLNNLPFFCAFIFSLMDPCIPESLFFLLHSSLLLLPVSLKMNYSSSEFHSLCQHFDTIHILLNPDDAISPGLLPCLCVFHQGGWLGASTVIWAWIQFWIIHIQAVWSWTRSWTPLNLIYNVIGLMWKYIVLGTPSTIQLLAPDQPTATTVLLWWFPFT